MAIKDCSKDYKSCVTIKYVSRTINYVPAANSEGVLPKSVLKHFAK